MKNVSNETKTPADAKPLLCAGLIRSIMDEFELFSFIRETEEGFIYWHTSFETEHLIRKDWDLKKLIFVIYNHSYEFGLWKGELKVQNSIKHAIGL